MFHALTVFIALAMSLPWAFRAGHLNVGGVQAQNNNAGPFTSSAQDSVGVTAGLLFLRLGFSLPEGVVGLLSPPLADFLEPACGTSVCIGGGGEGAGLFSFGATEGC